MQKYALFLVFKDFRPRKYAFHRDFESNRERGGFMGTLRENCFLPLQMFPEALLQEQTRGRKLCSKKGEKQCLGVRKTCLLSIRCVVI